MRRRLLNVLNRLISQLSDIEARTNTDTDQHMLQRRTHGSAAQPLAACRGCGEEGVAPASHSLGFGLGVCDLADEDGVLRVTDVPLLVHVGGSDGEHGAVVVEGQRGDAGRVAVELAQALLVEGVPDVDEAVRAT